MTSASRSSTPGGARTPPGSTPTGAPAGARHGRRGRDARCAGRSTRSAARRRSSTSASRRSPRRPATSSSSPTPPACCCSIEGSARVRLRAADNMNFAEGTLWSEPGAGTNAIGTALAADHAVQVFGPEHFSEDVQRWTCSAAPIHDPDTGEPLGIIDLTGDFSTVHPHSLAVATATARPSRRAAPRHAGARHAPARPLRRPRRGRAGLPRAVTATAGRSPRSRRAGG